MVIWAICVIDPLKPSCHSFRSSGVLAKALGREVLLEQQPCHAAFAGSRWSTHDVEDLQISKGSAVTALRLQSATSAARVKNSVTLPSEKVSKNQWLQRQSGQPRCLQSEKLGTEELDGIQNLVGNDLSVNSLLSLARDWSCDKGFIVVVVVLFCLNLLRKLNLWHTVAAKNELVTQIWRGHTRPSSMLSVELPWFLPGAKTSGLAELSVVKSLAKVWPENRNTTLT